MTTDYRAMCAELLDELELWSSWHDATDLKDRAAAALHFDQPGPQPPAAIVEMVNKLHQINNPAIQSVAPADEEIGEWHDQCADLTRLGEVDHYWAFDLQSDEVAGVVRAVLAFLQRQHPQPVPVSERLPGPEDCDGDGRCWIFMPDIGTAPSWRLTDPRDIGPYHTHWLPHHALPTPEANS